MSYGVIKGHGQEIGRLRKALAEGRIAHAYLFLGPAGIGKRLVAVNVAKELNCLAEGARPCDACASCKKIDAGSHPDVRVLEPLEDKSAISIDQVRDCIKDASLKPYEARRKVYIIDGAGRMKHEAQSAFLKTLEEPSPATVFILIAGKAEELFPTIVSRAENVPFRAMAKGPLKDLLAAEHGIDPVRAHILAGISSGRIGEAIRYAADEEFFQRRSAVIDGLIDRTYFDADTDKLPKEELREDLDIILTWYRDVLLTKAGGGAEIVNIDRREAIAAEAGRRGFGYLERAIEETIAAGWRLDANVNQKLALGVLGMELA